MSIRAKTALSSILRRISGRNRQTAFIVPDDRNNDDIENESDNNEEDEDDGEAQDKIPEMKFTGRLNSSSESLMRDRERQREKGGSDAQLGGIVSFRMKEGVLSFENRNINRRRESSVSSTNNGVSDQEIPHFYWFLDKKIAKEYKDFAGEYFDLPTLVVVCIIGIVFHLTRNYAFITVRSSPYLLSGLALELFGVLGMLFSAALSWIKRRQRIDRRIVLFFENFMIFCCLGRAQDVVGVIATVSFGLQFYSRVAGGPCADNQSIWHNETCNYGDSCGLIPADDALFLYLIPLIIQLCFRGIDFQTILLCWAISTAFVLCAVLQRKFYRSFWYVVLSLFFLMIITEGERFMRLSYIQRLQLVLAEKRTRELERTRAANELQKLETKHRAEISHRVKQRDHELVQVTYTLDQLEANNYKIWFQMIQLDRFEGVVERVQDYVNKFPHLAGAKDADGRFAVDVARRNVKKILQTVMLWHGRYRLLDSRPEHTSATCYVYKAMDELTLDETGQPMRVAIKLMRRKDQFIREIEARKKGFGPEYVVNIITTYPYMGVSSSVNDTLSLSLAALSSAQKRANIRMARFSQQIRSSSVMETQPVSLEQVRTLDDYPDVVEIDDDDSDDDFEEVHDTMINIPSPTRTRTGSSTSSPPESFMSRRALSGELTKAQAENFFCIVMPLADRNMFVSLKQERWAGKNIDMVRHAFGQLVKCVEHIHSRGVIHGDLKPLNIVRIGGHWRLIDLDAACAVGLEPVGHKSSSAYIPPEAVYTNNEKNIARVRTPFGTASNGTAGVEPLMADPTFDIWALGCIFYQLCTSDVRPLFGGGQDDNLTDDRSEEDNLWTLAEWTADKKKKKLTRVMDPLARNLLSQLLQKDPKQRPNLPRILAHPFLSARKVARMIGEKAGYDVFISYRASSDEQHAEILYDMLTAKGVKVWWDKKCLQPGEDWKEGFCAGLVNSHSFVCVLSRAAINHRGKDRQNFCKLAEDSPCDHVYLEHRLAVELQGLGLIEKIFPVMVGDYNAATDTYGNYIKDGCFPNAPFTCVRSVEADLLSVMESQALGTPLEANKTVASVLQKIVSCQGTFVEGARDQAFTTAVDSICSMLHINDDADPLDEAVDNLLRAKKFDFNAKNVQGVSSVGTPAGGLSLSRRNSF